MKQLSLTSVSQPKSRPTQPATGRASERGVVSMRAVMLLVVSTALLGACRAAPAERPRDGAPAVDAVNRPAPTAYPTFSPSQAPEGVPPLPEMLDQQPPAGLPPNTP